MLYNPIVAIKQQKFKVINYKHEMLLFTDFGHVILSSSCIWQQGRWHGFKSGGGGKSPAQSDRNKYFVVVPFHFFACNTCDRL